MFRVVQRFIQFKVVQYSPGATTSTRKVRVNSKQFIFESPILCRSQSLRALPNIYCHAKFMHGTVTKVTDRQTWSGGPYVDPQNTAFNFIGVIMALLGVYMADQEHKMSYTWLSQSDVKDVCSSSKIKRVLQQSSTNCAHNGNS